MAMTQPLTTLRCTTRATVPWSVSSTTGRMVACAAMLGASTGSDVRRYRAKLVEGHLTLVDDVARAVRSDLHLGHGAAVQDDLIAYGREALVKASRIYDSRRGVPFAPYARHRVRGAILDGVGEMGGVPRRLYRRLRFDRGASEVLAGWTQGEINELSSANEVREALHTAYMVSADAAGDRWLEQDLGVDGEAGAELLCKRLRAALDGLPPRERQLLMSHYYDGDSLAEVGKRLGISPSWAARLQTKALTLLRKRMGL